MDLRDIQGENVAASIWLRIRTSGGPLRTRHLNLRVPYKAGNFTISFSIRVLLHGMSDSDGQL
jgi:hypothetical protein